MYMSCMYTHICIHVCYNQIILVMFMHMYTYYIYKHVRIAIYYSSYMVQNTWHINLQCKIVLWYKWYDKIVFIFSNTGLDFQHVSCRRFAEVKPPSYVSWFIKTLYYRISIGVSTINPINIYQHSLTSTNIYGSIY